MSEQPDLPQPHPALRRLDRLVGRWTMEGHLVGSDDVNIRGETSFRWLPGGFFLEQRGHIDFMGLQIDSLEVIGYDPETDTFPSTVYSNSTDVNSRISSLPTGGGVVVDIGTGDGRFVYRSARANPDKFYIGIDAQATALEKISETIHRKPKKGGLDNVLFVHASVEALPPELNHIADEIHIHFPWASLLRAVILGDPEVLAALRRLARPGAWLEVVIGVDELRDAAELRRLQLPRITEEYVGSTLAQRYAAAGFDVQESGIEQAGDWTHIETTWAKRLDKSNSRRLLLMVARATA